MVEFYLQIKLAHILCVILSGSLFAVRGLMTLAGSRLASLAALRYLAYGIDTGLLTAALMLMTIVHQYPFVNSWLTVKILLLALYVALAMVALNPQRTRHTQVTCYLAALVLFLYIVSVARTHSPWGILSRLMT